MNRPIRLEPEERACLRYLARRPESAGPGPFSPGLLERLVTRGLVEAIKTLALPVLGQPVRYRLTPLGRSVLGGAGE